jgi:hypothetical protein
MITLEQKKLEEILDMTKRCKRLLVLGCETCAAMSFAGGQRQVAELASAIRVARKTSGDEGEVLEEAIARQCEPEFVDLIGDKVSECDAVLSLACGAGVQLLAERFPNKVALPGCNTTFLGVTEELGCGRNAVRDVGTAYWTKRPACALLPGVRNNFSMARAGGP